MHSLALPVRAALVALLISTLALSSSASTIFVATMRAPSGPPDSGGHLYSVDDAAGTSTFVGPVLIDGVEPVGLTCMAVHPATHVLYAITGGINDAKRGKLLTIDPRTATARVVGRLSRPLSDISFDPAGRLFGWTINTGQLALVDLDSAKVTPIGAAGEAGVGGAFAIDPRGHAFVAKWSGPARLDRVDLATGVVAPGPALRDLRDVSTLRSMAFSNGGDLFGTHSIRATQGSSLLLRIDPDTGRATPVRELPEDSEAIAVGARDGARADALRGFAYSALAVLVLAFAVYHFRSRRPSRPDSAA